MPYLEASVKKQVTMVAPSEEDHLDGPVPGTSGEQQMKRQVTTTYNMLQFSDRHVSMIQTHDFGCDFGDSGVKTIKKVIKNS